MAGRRKKFGSLLERQDMFGVSVPQFNLRGESQVKTICGGGFSVFILAVTFLFAWLKLVHLIEKKNPEIITNIEKDAFREGDNLDTTEDDFMMAFALEDFFRGSLNDPRYIRWNARYVVAHSDGSFTTNYIPLHPCTESDLSNLKSMDKRTSDKLKKMREKDGLFCLDWAKAKI